MIYFPQLFQYPIVKRRTARTLVNECLDGSQIKLQDAQAEVIQWELTLSELTSEEWGAIAALFSATEGRLQDFVFLDPTDNLLVRSEELGSMVWAKDVGLELTAQVEDPLGTNRATRVTNAGQAIQRLQQALEIPAGLQYCFSVFTRSAAPAQATLFQLTETKEAARAFGVGAAWQRLVLSCKLDDTQSASTTFGIELNAGAQVEVFGFQVEAQPGASAYKKTTSRCGIYPKARFQDDRLTTTTTSFDRHSCVIRIVSQTRDQG